MDNMNWQQSKHEPREVRDSENVQVAFCGCFPEELAHRRARLIAAAPKLLAALIAIYDRHDADTMTQARAAFAEATGATAAEYTEFRL